MTDEKEVKEALDKMRPEEAKILDKTGQVIGKLITECQNLLQQHVKEVNNGNLSNAIRSLTEAQLWVGKGLK